MSGAVEAGRRTAVRVVIVGRVQGVWYRGWAVEQATAHGLSGWVRNRSDGSVEALFAGPADRVEFMLAACRNGPPMAVVRHVAAVPVPDPGPGPFVQRATL